VFAAGGIGSVGCAVVLGQRGLPRRDITFMYVAWTLATFAVAGYGLAERGVAADVASLAQRARDRRHDRVGDRQAAPPAVEGRPAGEEAADGEASAAGATPAPAAA
jgi:hypothetical protein